MALLLGLGAAADEPAADDPAVVQVRLKVKERWAACGRGVLQCPAQQPICDNPKVAKGEVDEKLGLIWVGVDTGSTLCSASSPGFPGGVRAVFRVTVKP